jgi:hypothetical protein
VTGAVFDPVQVCRPEGCLPVGHRPVAMVRLHQDLLLEGVARGGDFIDLDSQAGSLRQRDVAVDHQDQGGHHLVAPRYVRADRLLDQEVGGREAELDRRGGGDRAERVVGAPPKRSRSRSSVITPELARLSGHAVPTMPATQPACRQVVL